MATQASTFEQIAAGDLSHVHQVEARIDKLLNDETSSRLALVHNGDKPIQSVKLEVFMKISDEEIEELKQLYVDAGWRNVKISRPLGITGVYPGFIFEADFV